MKETPKMPQLRIYHQGRYMYYRPGRTTVHFLPPLNSQDDSKKSVVMGTVANETSHSKGSPDRDDRLRRAQEYRKLVQHISNSLTKENVDDMKFLAKEHIYPTHLLDRISNGREFISLLEQKKFLAENSMHFLQTLLYYIARHDLYERLFRFRYGVQGNLRRKGVKIEEKYNLLQRSGEILQLPVKVKSFQNELHPRSRFNNADIPSMRQKLTTLSTRLDETRNKRIVHDAFPRNGEIRTDDIAVSMDTRISPAKVKQGRIDIGSVNEVKTVSTEESTSDNNLEKNIADMKLKKLRRQLNVNLTKRYSPSTQPTLIHYKRRPSRHSKNNPFVRKVDGSRGSVHTTYQEGEAVTLK